MTTEKVNQFLETYKGRDRILRVLCYGSKCAAGLAKSPQLALQLDKLSSQLSACRAALRLLDDFPMLTYVLEYGLGSGEKDRLLRLANVSGNILDLLFGPIDHIAWAIDHQIITTADSRWSDASTVCWVLSLYITVAKALRELALISTENSNAADIREYHVKLYRKKKSLVLTALRSSLDLIYAIHYLPNGMLWSGALKKWHVGALGTFSSAVALYQSLS